MTQTELYRTYHLVKKIPENQRTSTLVFDQSLDQVQPGQFVMVWLPEVGEKPYSIANDNPFTITVAAVGHFSEVLSSLETGARVWTRGPFGRSFQLTGKRHLLVGGGYGAAPLYFLAKKARVRSEAVHVCLGARSNEDILLASAFQSLGCEVSIATDNGSLGHHGLVTDLAEKVLADFRPDTLYACGPVPMLAILVRCVKENHLPAQLSWEAVMRCGIGLCGSCEMDDATRQAADLPSGWLTCKDGPVSFTGVMK
jgi:dihydroorotate dehydrogenase electron transfer subunit